MALPGGVAGILWGFVYHAHNRQRSGADGICIMSIGVATSNSILMVTFAKSSAGGVRPPGCDCRGPGRRPDAAAPVLMTAPAMLIRMVPMSRRWAMEASRMRRWAGL